MSDLNPKGIKINFDNKERHLLYTLNVIDQIQNHYDMAINEVMNLLYGTEPDSRKKSYSMLRYIITVLVNEDVTIHNESSPDDKWESVSENYIGRHVTLHNVGEVSLAVIKAYTSTIPDTDEDEEGDNEDDPNQMNG